MKTKTITTTKGEFLVLDLEAGARPIECLVNFLIYSINNDKRAFSIPGGNWQILGFIADLSEEQKGEIVEENKYGMLVDYNCKYNVSGEQYKLNDASESFASLLEANNVLLVNPFGENEPEIEAVCCCRGLRDKNGYEECCGIPMPEEKSQELNSLWQSAEQNTFRNALILKQI